VVTRAVEQATLPALAPMEPIMADNEAPQVPENPAPGILPEGAAPPATRMGDLGLALGAIAWAIVVIAVGMWIQG
jgi:hypothetical protein